MACFWVVGRSPLVNDALNIFAIVTESTGHKCLMSHMGAEANGHCLWGELVIIFETSDEVTGRTTSRAGVERRAMAAGDEFRVATDGDESSLEMAENVPNVGRRRTTDLAATKRHTPYMLYIIP